MAELNDPPAVFTDARDRLVEHIEYGDDAGGREASFTDFVYDSRRRPTRMTTTRESTGSSPGSGKLENVTRPVDADYGWDAASNPVRITDQRDPTEWPAGRLPPELTIGHDALYRVASVDYQYHQPDGSWSASDIATDWRAERTRTNFDGQSHGGVDPMREKPAPMLPASPTDRVVSLTYSWDWLANNTEWTDGQSTFYERSIGQIENGFVESDKRPTALYLTTNIRTDASGGTDPAVDRGGWAWVDYGEGGNVVAVTARAQCRDKNGGTACFADPSLSLETRRDYLRSSCVCSSEQHYQYRWDELNRLAEARRYDRSGSQK